MSSTLINNRWLTGDGAALISTTPNGKKMLWEKNASSPMQVQDAVDAAMKAGDHWRESLPIRQDILLRFADLLEQRRTTFARAIAEETGKPIWEAATEVSGMINKIAISIRAYQQRTSRHHNKHLHLDHKAHGVMAVFGPYNFPCHLPNGHIVPALLAGNTVVFKPSELSPWTAELTAQAWLDAGIPPGVINVVQGGREVGETLVDADVAGVLFTGSHTTGHTIHRQLAGRPEVLLALEMGGNNPLIVGQSHDTEVAANIIIHSAFLSAGQRCTCARRLIVVDGDKSDALIAQLIQVSKRIVVSDDINHDNAFMGPVISTQAARHLLDTQQQLITNGGKALLAMAPKDETHVCLSPGLIDMSEAHTVIDEESFGPLLQVFRVESFDAAIALANHTKFGLAAGLISDNDVEQNTFKHQIRAGVISINQPTAGASSELPFGGLGASGNHRPSAYYAADYCAWPQALSHAASTKSQAQAFDIAKIRGLR